MAAVLEPFLWAEGGTRKTPEEIARERKIADALLAPDFSPVGHWLQGLARMANAGVGALKNYRADKAEKANQGANTELVARLLSGETFPDAPAAPGASADYPSQRVSQAFGDDIKTGILSTADALGIDPTDLATAISYETAGTFDPTKKGPTTQWGQHRGLIQFGEPQAKKYGVDWNNPVGSQLGPNGAVANYLREAGVKPGMGMLDIYSAINAGRVGRYNASDAANGGAPGTVRDKVEEQMAGHRRKAMELLGSGGSNGEMGSVGADPMVGAPQQTAPQPIQVAQAQMDQMPEMAGRRQPSINPAIAEALSSPYADPGTQRIAQLLLGQQMEAQQAAQARQLEMQDPAYQLDLDYKRAQIAKMRRELETGGADAETFFGNPVPFEGRDGAIRYGQIGSKGTFRPIQLGEGEAFVPPTKQQDTGTEILTINQQGEVIARTPKQNFQEAADKAAGTVSGKTAGEVQAEYDSISSKMPGLMAVTTRLGELADKATYTTTGQFIDWANKEAGAQPRDAAVARAEYQATVDNQILPLLRDTFGAQFTAAEGEKLSKTLGDANLSPTEKHAVLNAFIQQKQRDIEALRSRVDGRTSQPGASPDAANDPLRLFR